MAVGRQQSNMVPTHLEEEEGQEPKEKLSKLSLSHIQQLQKDL
jgi:hypothetical protein